MTGRRSTITCATALLVLFASAGPAPAQQTDPKLWDEIQALKKGQDEIKKQLQEHKQLVQSRPAAPAAPDVRNVPLDLGDHPTLGSNTAKVTLIEFSDYQCPFCARHTRDTNPQIQNEYVATGKLRYAFFDMPLESIHKSAFKAAEATRCAGSQGKYWEMHALLFASQAKLEPFSEHAKALGLNVPAFEACMTAGGFAGAIRADMATAGKLGITGTPGFFLALSDPKDPRKVKGLALMTGAQPFANFKTEIDKALAAADEQPAK